MGTSFKRIVALVALGVTVTSITVASVAGADNKCSSRLLTDSQLSELGAQIAGAQPSLLVSKYFYMDSQVKRGAVALKPGTEFKGDAESPEMPKQLDRLKIDDVVNDFKLTRLQAADVQALLRNFTKYPSDAQFLEAIEVVRNGLSLSGMNVEKVKAAKFVAAVDVDGTLLDQDSNDKFINGVHKYSFLVDGSKVHHVAINPGALKLIKKVRELGGTVVIFSRNSDFLIRNIVSAVKVDGVPLADLIEGVLTSGHMILPEFPGGLLGAPDISRYLRKDLRLIENPRVVLIDDNPDYVWQQEHLLTVPEFSIKSATRESYGLGGSGEYGFGRSSGEFGFRGFGASSGKEKKEREKEEAKRDEEKKKKLQEHLKKMEQAYTRLENVIEYAAASPQDFNSRVLVYSEPGDEAYKLLIGEHKTHKLPTKYKKMSESQAIDFLLQDPSRVFEVLEDKERKPELRRFERGFPPTSGGDDDDWVSGNWE